MGGEVSYQGLDTLVLPLRRVAMRRALANLIGNAVRHGGGATVTLTRVADRAVIEVADRGPGIPESELERVFEPFWRLEPSRNRATGGVGLGLTIARRTVEAEGGSLRLRNRPDGGLSALLELPTPCLNGHVTRHDGSYANHSPRPALAAPEARPALSSSAT